MWVSKVWTFVLSICSDYQGNKERNFIVIIQTELYDKITSSDGGSVKLLARPHNGPTWPTCFWHCFWGDLVHSASPLRSSWVWLFQHWHFPLKFISIIENSLFFQWRRAVLAQMSQNTSKPWLSPPWFTDRKRFQCWNSLALYFNQTFYFGFICAQNMFSRSTGFLCDTTTWSSVHDMLLWRSDFHVFSLNIRLHMTLR